MRPICHRCSAHCVSPYRLVSQTIAIPFFFFSSVLPHRPFLFYHYRYYYYFFLQVYNSDTLKRECLIVILTTTICSNSVETSALKFSFFFLFRTGERIPTRGVYPRYVAGKARLLSVIATSDERAVNTAQDFSIANFVLLVIRT